jgi:hypothetical protein
MIGKDTMHHSLAPPPRTTLELNVAQGVLIWLVPQSTPTAVLVETLISIGSATSLDSAWLSTKWASETSPAPVK